MWSVSDDFSGQARSELLYWRCDVKHEHCTELPVSASRSESSPVPQKQSESVFSDLILLIIIIFPIISKFIELLFCRVQQEAEFASKLLK